MNEISAREALRTVPGTQEIAILWSLLSSPTGDSAELHNSVVTVATALDSIMNEFEFQFCHLPSV